MTAQDVACQPTDFASSTGALGQLFLQDGAMHSMFWLVDFVESYVAVATAAGFRVPIRPLIWWLML